MESSFAYRCPTCGNNDYPQCKWGGGVCIACEAVLTHLLAQATIGDTVPAGGTRGEACTNLINSGEARPALLLRFPKA